MENAKTPSSRRTPLLTAPLKHIRSVLKQWRAGYRGRLLYEYVGVMILVAFIILLSFLATVYIANDTAMKASRQSAEVIFLQARDRVEIFEEDISSLYMNVTNDSSVCSFFKAENLAQRWGYLEGFYQLVGNYRRLNRNLQNILLYDTGGNLIAAKGDVFIPKQENLILYGLSTFSGCITDKKTGESYFQVGMPVYNQEEGKEYQEIGQVYLLFDVKELQNAMDSALPDDDSAVAVLDRDGCILACAGTWMPEYGGFQEGFEDDEKLVYTSALGRTGWRLTSVVLKRNMLSGITQMQKINYITYAAVLIAMCLICIMIYRRIILPISVQTSFMADFTRDTGRRIEVTWHNEIGNMALKMNEMLDDIEALNREIIDSQRRYLELEYARKQTEMIAYKSQLNPHFLYNTFSCIRGMALYRGDREIAELTQSLSRFFRYNVKGDEWVTLQEALDNLQEYGKIIQYRFMGKYRIHVDADRELLAARLPKMLLQPLVENAVLHGLEPKTENGSVWVRVNGEQTLMQIAVQDDGCGFQSGKLEELREAMKRYDQEEFDSNPNWGIGILNVYRRLRLFYGKECSFEIESGEGGTTVHMTFPCR